MFAKVIRQNACRPQNQTRQYRKKPNFYETAADGLFLTKEPVNILGNGKIRVTVEGSLSCSVANKKKFVRKRRMIPPK